MWIYRYSQGHSLDISLKVSEPSKNYFFKNKTKNTFKIPKTKETKSTNNLFDLKLKKLGKVGTLIGVLKCKTHNK